MSTINIDAPTEANVTPDLAEFFQVGLDAVSPASLINEHLRFKKGTLSIDKCTVDLNDYSNCYLCGSGKAAASMAKAMDDIMGNYIGGGIVVSPEAVQHLKHATCIHSTHPLPSDESIHAADAMMNLFENAEPNELIIYLLSGGTSALLEKPVEPLTLDDMVQTTRVLLENGCSITETNAVRKHLSQVKGGRLAGLTRARIIVLVISDVIGDDLQTIGSAPLHSDQSCYAEIVEMLEKRALIDRLPDNVQTLLRQGAEGKYPETPKQPYKHVQHHLLASNQIALQGIESHAKKMGLNVVVQRHPIQGDVHDAAKTFIDAFSVLPKNTLYLCGGETTVLVKGDGRGGRNQHFALICLEALKSRFSYEIICAGTDGIDGNCDAAGAHISDALFRQSAEVGTDITSFIGNFDSNGFFERYTRAIKTGYTGTNVMDLVIAYKGE
jgi:hydroxypyruvate reductase/glycerate 2-kinase